MRSEGLLSLNSSGWSGGPLTSMDPCTVAFTPVKSGPCGVHHRGSQRCVSVEAPDTAQLGSTAAVVVQPAKRRWPGGVSRASTPEFARGRAPAMRLPVDTSCKDRLREGCMRIESTKVRMGAAASRPLAAMAGAEWRGALRSLLVRGPPLTTPAE